MIATWTDSWYRKQGMLHVEVVGMRIENKPTYFGDESD